MKLTKDINISSNTLNVTALSLHKLHIKVPHYLIDSTS